jgi:predicted Rossmann fold nucleotide-binding protein DprA/Smf involved in DNA uptake
MTTNNELAEQIERLVRDHVAGIRAVAAAAVERAFMATNTAAGGQPQRTRVTSAAARAEAFYAALRRSPGETMATLASQVGASPRALQVAVARLKRAGRVRAVGQRQFTRYFPMTTTTAAAAA